MLTTNLTKDIPEFSKQSGVTQDHAKAIAKVCRERNVFLFLRPTEAISSYCISQGFSTKSMDVHHKSSNWGPMAGSVPVDPAFDKKDTGKSAGQAVAEPCGREGTHGAAKHVQLTLTAEMVKYLTETGYIKEDKRNGTGWYVEGDKPAPSSQKGEYHFYLEKNDNGGRYTVAWKLASEDDKGNRHPLYVWGYGKEGEVTPVTGDYDVWMVVPHMAWWKLHTEIVVVKDEHGESASTLFNAWFIEQLNDACQRRSKPVFQHGAEAQNYGFTQALDEKIAMIAPGGELWMVERDALPMLLSSAMQAQYLVHWNKKYGDAVPVLASTPEDKHGLIKSYVHELTKLKIEKGNRDWAQIKAVQDKFLAGFKNEYAVYIFNDDLQQSINTIRAQPTKIKPLLTDEQWQQTPQSIFDLQCEFQDHVVSATVGSGESGAKLIEWLKFNPDVEYRLSSHFGPAPGPSWEGDFMLDRDGKNKSGAPVFKRRSAKQRSSVSAPTTVDASKQSLTLSPKSAFKLEIVDGQVSVTFNGKLA